MMSSMSTLLSQLTGMQQDEEESNQNQEVAQPQPQSVVVPPILEDSNSDSWTSSSEDEEPARRSYSGPLPPPPPPSADNSCNSGNGLETGSESESDSGSESEEIDLPQRRRLILLNRIAQLGLPSNVSVYSGEEELLNELERLLKVREQESNRPEALTENQARSYATVFDARVELFFKAVRGLESEQLVRLCEASWVESPLDTLRIFFQARDCRGGKGERQLFLDFMQWLSTKSTQNVLVNMELLPEYGRWLDLVQLAENQQVAEAVWVLLARQLLDDRMKMMKGEPISLCAKWIPTEGSKWDRQLRATKNVARALNVNLKQLRREYLTPLRAYLKIVENYMCHGQWSEIDYNKVPSRAMFRLKRAFARNDPERFAAWQQALQQGRPDVKVNAKVLFPHELVTSYFNQPYNSTVDQVLEAQWDVLMEEASKLGSFGRSLALCDVSGSMSGTPMMVSIALGLVISRFCPAPFTGKVITFHENPTFHTIQGKSLFEQVMSLRRAPWGGSTNFMSVFELILNKAVEHQVPAANMPNRLYVFSDMQFNQADRGNFVTNYEKIQQMYQEHGYEVPEIIFWNLRGDTMDFPVGDATQKGVAMVSGFTTSIMKALLNGRVITPVTVLQDVLTDERYQPVRYLA